MADPWALYSLEHEAYYEWGIRWQLPSGERITDATLTVADLWEWSGDPLSELFVSFLEQPRVLENAEPGTTSAVARYVDPEPGYSNFFRQYPEVLYYRQEPDAYVTVAVNFSTKGLVDDLSRAVADGGQFGFGIDPDCAFLSDRFVFTVTTVLVPAPGAALLGVIGLGLVGWAKRRLA